MNPAPIALFVYKRPDHLAQVIESLLKNEEAGKTDLYIFSDGPKNHLEKEAVQSVRDSIKGISGFASVRIKLHEVNQGLAQSIISGVTDVTREHGRVIVLEDDIVVGKYFLHYMNTALEKYFHKEDVASIHGYNLPIADKGLPESFFLRGADCWGWATWKRSWDLFETDGTKLLNRLESESLTGLFDLDGSHPYTQMLRDQIAGKNKSWAIRWHASMFLAKKFTLHPTASLVQNIGLDSSGTHCGEDAYLSPYISHKKILSYPDLIEENNEIRNLIIEFHKNPTGMDSNQVRFVFFRKGLEFLKHQVRRVLNFIKRNLAKDRMQTDKQKEWYRGDYVSWKDAVADCSGYTAPNILEKVKNSLLKVKNGEAVYERDSILFDEVQYSFPLLVCLLYVASASNNRLKLIDFGGSLGSSFFQNRKYLNHITDLSWSIVEQKHFVACGNEFFKDQHLSFFETISESKDIKNPNVILLSSVLPYLEDPYRMIEEILTFDFDFIIMDRTPFLFDDTSDKLLIQIVPPEIYEAEIPIWFINYKKFISLMNRKYVLHSSFDSMEEDFPKNLNIKNKCLLFEKEKYANK
ncbi:hypothetical protein LPTSP3_g21230 [Leptospira kobayashii]|uniref:Methyltransferase, TIGR04325 family n=2 Tax=Leptospira kobayashii TaxID=1917830 RepID=A0ABN6KDY6_9LEPT|nr:methyltransferase, TIGR04325 family [Leptospira kobayashii]BDA79193.1 hypothetical protein LPTSP3_g21230 [Leptospira kobayashii]